MEAYKRWVRRNKDYARSFEYLANALTWLLPEWFSDSEIGPEAVTTVLGLITSLNGHIIDTTPTPTHTGSAEPSSFPYSLCITLLNDLETLIEVAAEQFFGDDKKWNFIAATETTKALVRLALIRNSGYKMLLHGGSTPNVEKGSEGSNPQHRFGYLANPGLHRRAGYLNNYYENNLWNLEGKALSALSRFGESARMDTDLTWLHRFQHTHEIMEPPCFRGALFVVGEMMFITRPLIYVLLIRKYGVRSWFPWCISLAMDITGVGILSFVTMLRHGRKDQQFHLSDLEHNELRRRKLLWALYLMRDPFFNKCTRQRLESTGRLLEPIPIFGILTGKIMELIIGAQTRYTYVSGS